MSENPKQPEIREQPLRLNIQLSFTITDEDAPADIYEEIGTFARGIKKNVLIGGSLSKLLNPCCGDKKP
jgi:hypothetical protein